jgi:hypothetical protein
MSLPIGAKVVYRVDFENNSTTASIGTSKREESAQGSTGGSITAQPNPQKDARNQSSTVGRCRIPTGYRRAELSSQRLPTAGKTYLYRWSYYYPPDFFNNAEIDFSLVSQWKTYPCGYHDGYKAQICDECGIFNDLRGGAGTSRDFQFRWRARPDCRTHSLPVVTGEWVDFQMEVRWANDTSGYAVLWKNGVKVEEIRSVKTLFDNFNTNCNIYWAVGMYARWEGTRQYLDLYIDDIEILDTAGIGDVTPLSPQRAMPSSASVESGGGGPVTFFSFRGQVLLRPESGIIIARRKHGNSRLAIIADRVNLP